MREIKFRAWDNEIKRMIYEFSIVGIETRLDDDGSLIIGTYTKNGDWYELKRLQFTGLEDKNGKEIFEGDVIEWIAVGREGGNIEDIGRKMNMGKSKVFFEDGKFLSHNTIPVGHHYTDEIEVIGNIYENPELNDANQENDEGDGK